MEAEWHPTGVKHATQRSTPIQWEMVFALGVTWSALFGAALGLACYKIWGPMW